MIDTKFTDRDLIESIINNYYIVDYGFVVKINGDKVDVVHAIKSSSRGGKEKQRVETKNVELLFLSGSGFSIKWDVGEGDRVLLLGLKDYVESVKDVDQAKDSAVFIHYNRSNLKAIPFCLFNSDAAVKIEINNGKFKINAQDKIELNGNNKQFVTWAELNSALQNLISMNLFAAPGSPTATPVPPMTIDISSAKTSTIVTGG